MDYEKKYKEALNWMRSIYPTLTGSDKEDAEHYFPELKESEDERIRKEIMNFILYKAGAFIDEDTEHMYIAYLEKHKERGPLTKEEEYILHRIIEYLEDETCPSEWINLLHDIYCLPYEKQKGLFAEGPGHYFYDGDNVHFCSAPAMEVRELDDSNEPVEHWQYVGGMNLEEDKEEQKEQKPNYCLYRGDPSVERCKYCSAACSARLTEEQKSVQSKDERIRKALVEILHRLPSSAFEEGAEGGYLGATKEQMLAYLEKQKEQEHICDSAQYEEGFKTGLEIGLRKQKEQKLTENESDKMIDEIINTVTGYHPTHSTKEINEMVAWLEGHKSISKRIDAEVNRRVYDMIREAREKWDSKVDDAIDRMNSDELKVYLEENSEPNIPKPHKGDDSNPYDMGVSQAQEYAINRGFGIPFNDGEVYVDERHITQTIGNILRWADEHPKEQKPNIELIQKSWYMEGYHDRKFNNEPKWIIKTGEGGPRYEENPKYGQRIEQKSSEWSEKYIAGIFEKVGLAKIVREQGNDALTNAVQSAMIELSKSAEWSEEDERKLQRCIAIVEGWEVDYDIAYKPYSSMLKSLRPSWKPQPESLEALMYAIEGKWEMIKPTSYLSRRLEVLYEGLINAYNVDESYLTKLHETALTGNVDELRELKNKIVASIDSAAPERQDYSGLNDFEGAIHRGFLCAGVENVPVNIIKETAQDCLAHLPVEWSEEDLRHKSWILECLADGERKVPQYAEDFRAAYKWLKSLRPQSKVEWDANDKAIVNCIVCCLDGQFVPDAARKQSLEWFNKHRRDFLNCSSWKPSEDEERLINTSISFLKDFADKGYENAVECIDWLKSKLNGNTGK